MQLRIDLIPLTGAIVLMSAASTMAVVLIRSMNRAPGEATPLGYDGTRAGRCGLAHRSGPPIPGAFRMSTRQARPATTSPSVLMVIGRAVLGIAIGTAAAWVFVPADTAQAVIAIALPVVAALTAWYGGRRDGAAAIAGALWFGYAHTEPRLPY